MVKANEKFYSCRFYRRKHQYGLPYPPLHSGQVVAENVKDAEKKMKQKEKQAGRGAIYGVYCSRK